MARNPEGWKLVWKRGIAHVRFTHAGKRTEVSTRSRDPREASLCAARIYSDAVSGRVAAAAVGLLHPATPLSELCTDWLEAIAPELGAKTGDTYTVYSGHWIKHFGTLGGITTPAIGDYQRKRLGSVQRATLVKERSALLRFLSWCIERQFIREAPAFPTLPKKAIGTKHKQGRSKPRDVRSQAEVRAILSELAGKALHFHTALYETGLRPVSTLRRLQASDLTPFGLYIRPECDKNRWERTVPLTLTARAALAAGLPFTEDHREAFRAAVARALGPDARMTPYELKHARVTHWRDAGVPDNAIRFLTGTTAALGEYNHPTRGAAERGLEIWCHSGAGEKGAVMAEQESSCEGRDLNPDGSYPASTSIKSGSQNASKITDDGSAAKVAKASNSGPRLHNDPRLPAVVRVALFNRARRSA